MFRVGNMELHQSLVARVPDGHPGLREVHAKWHRRGDEPRLAQRKFERQLQAEERQSTSRLGRLLSNSAVAYFQAP